MHAPRPHPSPLRARPILAAACLLAALPLAAAGCGRFGSGGGGDGPVTLSGTVEAHEVPLSFQVGGRIARLGADEGDRVAAGDTVAELEAEDYQVAAARARAEDDAAAATLAELEAGTREQEIRVAEANVEKARADLDLAGTDLERLVRLVPEDAAPQSDLDRARRQKAVAAAVLAQAEETLLLLREGPRKEEIARARAEHAARRAAREAAERGLAYTRLVSPVAGVVTARMAEAGQVVASGQPVLRVAELTRPWVRAYLPEPDLGRVRLGGEAEVRVDGLPDRVFEGRLAFIAADAEFTPKVVETRELRVDLVYRVKVEVEDPEGRLKIGMPADVTLPLAAP
jgi:HlyD family secretion protein